MASRIEGDFYFAGSLTAATLTLPNSSVTDAKVAAGAAIGSEKLEHQHQITLAQVHGTASVDERRVVHVVYGATGTLLAFRAGVVVVATGNSTVTVNLLKNGTTVLTGVITLDNANLAYAEEAGTFSSTAVVAGDVIEVAIDATVGSGTLPQGVYAQLVLAEDAG